MKSKHPIFINEKLMKCIVCSERANSESDLANHYELKHITTNTKSTEKSQSQIKCHKGSGCKYLKQNRCSFSHEYPREEPWRTVQNRRQRPHQTQMLEKKKQDWKDVCKNGSSCKYWRENLCNFFHQQHREHIREKTNTQFRRGGGREDASPSQLRQCKYGDRCDQGMSCSYLHLAQDFLSSQGGRKN